MAQEQKIKGILLRKTLLANDDAFLEFFTDEMGKISLVVRKFVRSKKKAAEIDYFRLLELGIQKGRQSYRLVSVHAIKIFSVFTSDFEMNQKGFSWIERLRKITTEEHSDIPLFHKTIKIFSMVEKEWITQFDIFFRIKMLDFSGLFVRFDRLRSDVYFDPLHFLFQTEASENTIYIPNEIRQTIEFIRRSDFETWYEKKYKLKEISWKKLDFIISEIEKNHY